MKNAQILCCHAGLIRQIWADTSSEISSILFETTRANILYFLHLHLDTKGAIKSPLQDAGKIYLRINMWINMRINMRE
jgi:hypothetical protein